MKFTELVDSGASKTRQHEYLVDGEQIAITVRIPKNLKTAAAEAASLKGLSLSAFVRVCNFYLAFSKVNALRSELTWTHYRVLPRVYAMMHVFGTKYLTYLPPQEQLKHEIEMQKRFLTSSTEQAKGAVSTDGKHRENEPCIQGFGCRSYRAVEDTLSRNRN